MTMFPRPSLSTATFRARNRAGAWQVTRNNTHHSHHVSEGDALRAACLAARQQEAGGGRARVLTAGGVALSHNEPQFDRAEPHAGPTT